MSGKIEFIKAFRDAASQLDTYAVAGRWMRLHEELPALTAQEAAAWADLGYLPEEAEPQIRSGITAAAAAEMEDHAERQAGGPEALAAMRVAELLAADGMLGPDDAVSVQDPTDPGREIVMLREDLA
jgi:hypothetical protein